jgi:hypothetical protein
LNIDLRINKERQDYKIGTVWGGTCGMGRIYEAEKGKDLWLIDFMYIHEKEQ